MSCKNARRISEAVGTVALVLIVLLPKAFGSNADINRLESDNCGELSEGATHNRDCGVSAGAVPRPSNQQYIDRLRTRERWKYVLLQRLWEARRNSSTVGTHVPSSHYQNFKDLLASAQPINESGGGEGGGEEQEPIARNRVYLPQCSGPRNFTGAWNDGTNFRLYFNVESAAESANGHRQGRVHSAYLHLKRKINPTVGIHRAAATSGRGRVGQQRPSTRRRRPLRGTGDDGDSDQLKVIVYLYSRLPKRTRHPEPRSVIRTVLFSRTLSGWLRINLTPTVEDWAKRPQRNFGIQVTVLNDGGTEELPPGEYFDGFNCTEDQSHSAAPVEMPLYSVEDTLGQSSSNDTVVDSDMNLTQPYLDIITTEVGTRSRPRHQRDLRALHSVLRNA